MSIDQKIKIISCILARNIDGERLDPERLRSGQYFKGDCCCEEDAITDGYIDGYPAVYRWRDFQKLAIQIIDGITE